MSAAAAVSLNAGGMRNTSKVEVVNVRLSWQDLMRCLRNPSEPSSSLEGSKLDLLWKAR